MGLWVKVRVFSDFFMLTLGDVFILRVEDVHTGLYHLFADNLVALLHIWAEPDTIILMPTKIIDYDEQ